MRIKLSLGDITKQKVDAIVNAANSSLMGGGGVDGAIHAAGGSAILAECKKIVSKQGRLPTGEAVITTGGKLPAKYVIHTVGPVWGGGDRGEADLLRNCYINSLELAMQKGVRTIAFPSISTGAYRYPAEEAAQIALKAVADYLKDNSGIAEVNFVLYNEAIYKVYDTALGKIQDQN
jgi:O-acetyl-ADP-ribose deacetylase